LRESKRPFRGAGSGQGASAGGPVSDEPQPSKEDYGELKGKHPAILAAKLCAVHAGGELAVTTGHLEPFFFGPPLAPACAVRCAPSRPYLLFRRFANCSYASR
jgi:hypothetical protein